MSDQLIAEGDVTPASELISLELHFLVNTAQQQNGLRHRDFQRYRRFCARRVARLRKSTSQQQGDRHGYKPKGFPAKVTHRHLLILLFNAERAWSYAMQLKQEIEGEEDASRKAVHLRGRLYRAVTLAEELRNLCIGSADARSVLEADAYLAWMCGNLNLEKESVETALKYFVEAKASYESLESVANSDHRPIFAARVSDIEPSVRYCEYFIGGEEDVSLLAGSGDLLKGRVAEILEASLLNQAKALGEVDFFGKSIPILNEKVRLRMVEGAALNERIATLKGEENIACGYGDVLVCYTGAVDLIERDIEASKLAVPRTAAAEVQETSMAQLIDYIEFLRLTALRNRSVYLAKVLDLRLQSDSEVSKRLRPDELVFLYDKAIFYITEMTGIAVRFGVSDYVDPEQTAFEAMRLFFRAEGLSRLQKFQEAYVLYTRCLEMSAGVDTLNSFASRFRSGLIAAHASGLVHTVGDPSNASLMEVNTSRPLTKRLGEFTTGSSLEKFHLVDFPPRFQNMVNKPVLYDLAYNEINYPNLSNRGEEKKGFWSSFW